MKTGLFALLILLLSQAGLAEDDVSTMGLSKYGASLLADCDGLYRSFNLYQTLYPRGTDATAQLNPEDLQIKSLQDKSELLLILINLNGMPGYRPIENKMKCLQSLNELNQHLSEERSKQMGFSENSPDQVTVRASRILEFAEQKLVKQTNK